MNLTFYNAQAMSHKIGLSKSPAVASFTDRDFNRLHYLSSCLAAVKSVLDTYTGMPIEKLHTLTIPMVLQLTWNCGHLHLLSSFEHPDWDLTLVADSISLLEVMHILTHKMSQVKAVLGYDPQTAKGLDFWSLSAHTLTKIDSFFKGKAAEEQFGNASEQDRNFETPTFQNYTPGPDFMDFMDDVWMRDAMASSDYQEAGARWDT